MATQSPRLLALRLLVALAVSVPAHADPVTSSTLGWAVNGIVSEVARAGDVAYVGGSFNSVAPSANLVFNFATFATDSAVPVLPRLDLNGRVRAVVEAPGGGWILGGEFTRVNGVVRQRLARLLADGTLDPTFNASADDTVWALAVSGTRVFAGGEFTSMNGTSRNRLVALDATTGALDATFTPSITGGAGSVCTLAISNVGVIAGGDFGTVNGNPRANLVALDLTTGATVAGFTATADGRVAKVLVNGSAAFVAGEFDNVGGLARKGVARLDATTGAASAAFNAQANGVVTGLAASGARVYVGGAFGQIGGASRAKVAELDAVTGVATTWNPGANGDVEQVALRGSVLVAAGHFTTIGGVERLRLAALDTTATAAITLSWNPSLDSSADALFIDVTGRVFVGGSYNYFGAVPRRNAAALDLKVGSLLPWNPSPDGWVRALDIHENVLYIGGDFMTIGGASRHFIAAVDAVTGAVSAWNPRPDQRVNGLQVVGSTVYFVGDFIHVSSTTARGHGAAASLDGTVLAWDPQADDTIEALAVAGSRVYLGGLFGQVGGSARQRLAAVDATSGAVDATFAPSVTGTNAAVYRVDVDGATLFFGGRFSMVSGSTRHNAAAVTAAPGAMNHGTLLGWNPDVSGDIYDLDAFGDDVYLAGGFGAVGGSSRPGIAMVDALPGGGALRAWKPVDVAGGSVSVIDTSETAVLFGGLLYDLNYLYIGAVLYPEAALPGVPPQPTTPRVRTRADAVTIDWGVPSLGARPASYVIEAGTGPGLSNLVNGSTGNSATTIAAAGLPPGVYYFRLRSANVFGVSAATEDQAFAIGGAGCSGPPAAPTDLVATVAGTNVTLTWRAPVASIASTYRLTAGTTSGGREVGTFDVGAATSFSTAVPGGAFFVTVQATNACGLGPSSAEAVVIVGAPVVPPAAPFGLEASRSGNTVTFTWGAPSIGTAPFTYRLEAGTAPGLRNLADVALGTSSLVVPGVPPGIYYVRVRAVGPGGTGPAGNEVTLVVP